MIGAFARKLGTHDKPQLATDYEKLTESAADAPPEQFVERFPHEGGDVFLAPVLETLRAVLSRVRGATTLTPTPSENDTAPKARENV
ncbi:MAG: hypothetical protein WDA16_04715 [Candidatus Thermoplasmatota archaeon]